MIKILVVGQTPPPYHGQAMMIERLLQGRFERAKLYHVRMAFSDSIGEVGRFRIGKVLHLAGVVLRIIYHRIVHGTTVLYYPPAGPHRVPLYRDLVILLCTRWMFRRTIFHFHATGVSQLYAGLPPLLQACMRRALFDADAAIRITKSASDDANFMRARRQFVVPNGIEDEAAGVDFKSGRQAIFAVAQAESRSIAAGQGWNENPADADSRGDLSPVGILEAKPLAILFVGILRASKGLLVLLDACGKLSQRGTPFQLKVAGDFQSPEFKAEVHDRIAQLGIADQVHFIGVVKGEAKRASFMQADVFCFPSYYESETFPLVMLEAMSFALPIVATRWRGIPEILDDGETGFLVDPHDAAAVADRLEQLHSDAGLRTRLGNAGRAKFLQNFTAQRFWERMEAVFVEIATQPAALHSNPRSAALHSASRLTSEP